MNNARIVVSWNARRMPLGTRQCQRWSSQVIGASSRRNGPLICHSGISRQHARRFMYEPDGKRHSSQRRFFFSWTSDLTPRYRSCRQKNSNICIRKQTSWDSMVAAWGLYPGMAWALHAVIPPKVIKNKNLVAVNYLATSSIADDAEIRVSAVWSYVKDVVRWLQDIFGTCWDMFIVSIRGGEILLRLSPLTILTPAAALYSYLVPFQRTNKISDIAWWYLKNAVQGLGPAYVKLCQWIATRPDIFPPFVCHRLSSLHDQGQRHSWRYTHSVLVDSFGHDYREKGLNVDWTSPIIGCGSAAQVYRGTLNKSRRVDRNNTDGEKETHDIPVAIKVLHPRFKERIERDLWLLQTVGKLLHSLPLDDIKMINLPRATENFANSLRRQSDLRIESENLKQFRANFYDGHGDEERISRNEQRSAVYFPKPMEGWTSSQVLVEGLIENAVPIADCLHDLTAEGSTTRKELAGPLLRAFLKMVFVDNFVHGDLHPGNILIHTSTRAVSKRNGWSLTPLVFRSDDNSITKTETKRTIIFLDAGIATSLSPTDQQNLKDLFRAVILNNGNKAGRLMIERTEFERCSQTPGCVDAFASGIEELVSEFHGRRQKGLTLGSVRIGSLLTRVLHLCRVHGVEMDPAMATVVLSTLVLEGLGRSLEPDLNLIDAAIPFVLGRGHV